ncbi:MAG: universal stress protein [Chitinophagaceae bacterium]
MEKILLVIDPANQNMPAFEFACYLARLTDSKITGVFLEHQIEPPAAVHPRSVSMYVAGKETTADVCTVSSTQSTAEAAILSFKQACERKAIRCSVHRDRGVPATEIVDESRYADVIIIDADTSLNSSYNGIPSGLVKDVLAKAECPIIIAPQSFNGIDEIVLTYNGTKSCVFAIKQFTYLFPQLADTKTIVLQVNEAGEWADPDKHNFKEWLQNYYSVLGFDVLRGDADDKLFDFLFKRKNVMIVMGAYGRSAISRFFRRSTSDLMINTITQPIFIAHY